MGSYRDVIVEGLAPDGGLAVPVTLPHIADELESLRALTYPQLAANIIGRFATDVPVVELERIAHESYNTEKFSTEAIVPLKPIGGSMALVGLSEGPTLAFKDLAMQFLGGALDYVLTESGDVLNIVGATSGDTGSAAEYAIRGRSRLSAIILSPQGRMSAFQRAQMYSLLDDNIHNLTVEGNFDDCQHLVKLVSQDLDFKRAQHIGAVNSINFGRISAQIAYYVWAWLRATDAVAEADRATFEVSFAVPSGNFGNILSGHYARSMGVPIRKLILATNENNVLHEFFSTGIYRPRSADQTPATSSPSMDVSKASNLERFVYEVVGRSPERTAELWQTLDDTGSFDLSGELARFATEYGIVSGTSTHANRISTMRSTHETSGVTIDPHTADGVYVAAAYVEPDVPMLVLETALPAKFADTVEEALGSAPEVTAEHAALLALPQRTTDIPNDERALRAFIETHALH